MLALASGQKMIHHICLELSDPTQLLVLLQLIKHRTSFVYQASLNAAIRALTRMADFKAFLEDLAIQNTNLVCEINQLAIELRINIKRQDEVYAKIKTLLLKIYDSIAMLSKQIRHPDVRNPDILPVWRSFLAPISALSQLPSGHFLSARVVLYLSSGLLNQRALDLKFSKIGSAIEGRPVFRLCRAIDDTCAISGPRVARAKDSTGSLHNIHYSLRMISKTERVAYESLHKRSHRRNWLP